MKLNKTQLSILVLFIFYSVGILGLSFDSTRSFFLNLTPFNLLLTLGIIFYTNKRTKAFCLSFMVVAVIGFFVEVVGVESGVLFGEYQYGEPLGPGLFNVPFLIGVNWFILAYASWGTTDLFLKKPFLRIIVASALMVAIDIIIEPVAISLDFWTWEGGGIPLQNYVMWFLTAALIHFIISILKTKFNATLAFVILVIQFFFFSILNITL